MLIESIYRPPKVDQDQNYRQVLKNSKTVLRKRKRRYVADTDPNPTGTPGSNQIIQTPDYYYETLPNPLHMESQRLTKIRGKQQRREIIQSLAGNRNNLTDVKLNDDMGKLLTKIDQQGSLYTMNQSKEKIITETGIDPQSLYQPFRNGILLDSIGHAIQEKISQYEAADKQLLSISDQATAESLAHITPQPAKLSDQVYAADQPQLVPFGAIHKATDTGLGGIMSGLQNQGIQHIRNTAEKIMFNSGLLQGENAYPYDDTLVETPEETIHKKIEAAKEQIMTTVPELGTWVAEYMGSKLFGTYGSNLQPAIQSLSAMLLSSANEAITKAYDVTIAKVPLFAKFKDPIIAGAKALMYFKNVLMNYLGTSILATIKLVGTNPGLVMTGAVIAGLAFAADKTLNGTKGIIAPTNDPVNTFSERIVPQSVNDKIEQKDTNIVFNMAAASANHITPQLINGTKAVVNAASAATANAAQSAATLGWYGVQAAAAATASLSSAIITLGAEAASTGAGATGSMIYSIFGGVVDYMKGMGSSLYTLVQNKVNTWVDDLRYSVENASWGFSKQLDYVEKVLKAIVREAHTNAATQYKGDLGLAESFARIKGHQDIAQNFFKNINAHLIPIMSIHDQMELSSSLNVLQTALNKLMTVMNGPTYLAQATDWLYGTQTKDPQTKIYIEAFDNGIYKFMSALKNTFNKYKQAVDNVMPSEWIEKFQIYRIPHTQFDTTKNKK